MNIEDAAEQLNRAIHRWSKGNRKLTVAIDGYAGVGKTTLLEQLAKLNRNILPVHRDDFLLSRAALQKLLKQTEDRSRVFELQNCDTKKIESLAKAFRGGKALYATKVFDPGSGNVSLPKSFDLTKKVLVVEGVFMFHPRLADHLWDRRVYLKGNIEEIDERRVRREKARWGKDYFPESHPDSYFRHVIIALKRYQETYAPEERADLILEM